MIVASQRAVFDIAAPPLRDLPLVLLKLRLLRARSHRSQTRPCCRAHMRGIRLFSNGFDAVPDQVRRIVPQITRTCRHRGADQPPGGSQANPPGVLTQFTGPPEFETAEEPSGPHGMPTAGRVSKPAGGFGDVDVGGVVGHGRLRWRSHRRGGGYRRHVLGGRRQCRHRRRLVTTGRGPTTGGAAGGGGGGAMNAGGAVDNAGTAAVGSAEVVSTLVGVSLD